MAYQDTLFSDAGRSYEAGRMREAAVTFRAAANAAREVSDSSTWYKGMVWMAVALVGAGDNLAALSALLTARREESSDSPRHEAWVARKKHYEIVEDTRPMLHTLEAVVSDLTRFAASNAVPKADLPIIRAGLHGLRGHWEAMLAEAEYAWTVYDGSGYYKSVSADTACQAALELGRNGMAQDWLAAHAQCRDEPAYRKFRNALYSVKAGISEGLAFDALAKRLESLRSIVFDIDIMEGIAIAQELTVRVQLLNPSAPDPNSREHLSVVEMCRKVVNKTNVHFAFSRRLLCVDYRIACLRYAVGMPPVDDLFHRTTQLKPRVRDALGVDEINRRLSKAHAALGVARTVAIKLDHWLKCGWRQESVDNREQRVDALVNFGR